MPIPREKVSEFAAFFAILRVPLTDHLATQSGDAHRSPKFRLRRELRLRGESL